ncbi:MAG: M48 family metalloprotease [Desulfobacterales bacterium]|nr:M48 family metalloprotease [Desulfobacterales bacterium]
MRARIFGFRTTIFGAITTVLMLSMIGCELLEPALQMATELGVDTGYVSRDQADSINKSAAAAGKTVEDITPEQEYYIGRSVAATILGRHRPYNDEEANLYVNQVGQSLALASDRPYTFGGYHFLIVDSPEINAFAAPGGLVLVTRGMLKLCKTEDALAAVLAHEIGHVQAQHGLKAIKTARLTSALTLIATESAKNMGVAEVAQVAEAFEGSISDITSTLVNNGYGRLLEQEADSSAVILLRRVGYNPQALVEMLTEMEKRLKPGGLDFAKTHPDPEDRIDFIRQAIGSSPTVSAAPAVRKLRFELAMGSV